MRHQAAAERALQYGLLIINKNLYTFRLQNIYRTGSHIDNLLVLVADALMLNPGCDFILGPFIEEAEEQVACLCKRQDFQFVCILHVHNLVADVVGSLHEVHQRMSCVCSRSVGSRESPQAKLVGNLQEGVLLSSEKSEFSMLSCLCAGKGVFHNACQCRVGHGEATLPTSDKAVCEQSESVGVALEVCDVSPESLADEFLDTVASTLGKECLYSLLAAMSKWRVAKVVRQTCRCHNGANLLKQRIL